MKDVLVSISLMDPAGKESERKIEEETSPTAPWVWGRTWSFSGEVFPEEGKGEEIHARIEEIKPLAWRNNPMICQAPDRFSKTLRRAPAGKLIEETGLKGARVGDAQVSEKHANFIVNVGKASARDILELAERVREAVSKEKRVLLEMEIQVAGEN